MAISITKIRITVYQHVPVINVNMMEEKNIKPVQVNGLIIQKVELKCVSEKKFINVRELINIR